MTIRIELTEREHQKLCTAVELRVEACRENKSIEDDREAQRWEEILFKLRGARRSR